MMIYLWISINRISLIVDIDKWNGGNLVLVLNKRTYRYVSRTGGFPFSEKEKGKRHVDPQHKYFIMFWTVLYYQWVPRLLVRKWTRTQVSSLETRHNRKWEIELSEAHYTSQPSWKEFWHTSVGQSKQVMGDNCNTPHPHTGIEMSRWNYDEYGSLWR